MLQVIPINGYREAMIWQYICLPYIFDVQQQQVRVVNTHEPQASTSIVPGNLLTCLYSNASDVSANMINWMTSYMNDFGQDAAILPSNISTL